MLLMHLLILGDVIIFFTIYNIVLSQLLIVPILPQEKEKPNKANMF